MIIKTSTRLIALIGMPLHQSLSSIIQNTLFRETGLDYFYIPIEIPDKDNLSRIISAVKCMNFAGIAITTPYKDAITDYLDKWDPLAEKIGACNTVVIKDGIFTGYNTDGIGAVNSFTNDIGLDIEGLTVLCLGAGGTAKSVCLELAGRKPKHIYIVSRSEKCGELSGHINRFYPGLTSAIRAGDTDSVKKAAENSGFIMNLTGLGMASKEDLTPMDKSLFMPGHICFDAVYNPAKTRFLAEAEERGCRILNGLNMLAYQGAEQFKLWTGVDNAPAARMVDILSGLVNTR